MTCFCHFEAFCRNETDTDLAMILDKPVLNGSLNVTIDEPKPETDVSIPGNETAKTVESRDNTNDKLDAIMQE